MTDRRWFPRRLPAPSLLSLMTLLAASLTMTAAGSGCPGEACTEWIAMGPGPARSLIYRTQPLDTRDARVTRALVVVHDIDRDAREYLETAVAAARLAGGLDETIVVAPRFASREGFGCSDALAPDEINWPCEGNSWRSGAAGRGSVRTSFDVVDEILKKLARKRVFPNLASIVVAGHSAGGQFVTRYAMANRVHDRLALAITYVVANPSSYAYPDPVRPVIAGGLTEFQVPRQLTCEGYDRWPYGLNHRSGYTAATSAAVLKKQLVSRPTTYLLGGRDVLPVDGFDTSCAAMTQGRNRLERGRAFAEYLNQTLGARHTVAIVPHCGHDASCMFASAEALRVLFPKR